MPRAVVVDAFGPPESFALREVTPRPLGPAELRVAVKAAGISFVDVLTAAGNYQVKPPLPFIPGSEAAGVVSEAGTNVTGFAPGDAILFSGWGGMFAEEAIVAEGAAQPIPAGMDFAEAAVFPVSYATAWHALVDRARIAPGETLLVLGAGGATGVAAVQIGKHLGARVIGSASSEAKRAIASEAGADALVDARGPGWREAVKAANGGKPVDVVFDPVGGDATDPAFRALGWGGRHLVIGFPGGIAALHTNLPLLKGASLVGVDIRQFGEREPERARANRETIFALGATGALRPIIAKRYRFEDYAAAMADAATGASAGRIVLDIA